MAKWLWLLFGIAFLSLLGARYAVGYWDAAMWLPLALSAITFTAAFILDFRKIKKFFFLKTTKNGASLGLSVLLLLALLVGVNFIIYKKNIHFDISKNKVHTLSKTTQDFVSAIATPVRIEAFYIETDVEKREQAHQLLQRYREINPKIQVDFKDPNLFPDLVQEKSIAGSGTLIFNYKGKQNRLLDSDGLKEEQVTSLLYQLGQDKTKTIYYSSGHGEKDLEDTTELGANEFKKGLESLGYQIRVVRLLELKKIPEDMDTLIILGPQFPFEESELKFIKDYLAIGGSLELAIDPGYRHNLARITKLLDVEFSNLYMVDLNGQQIGSNAAVTVGGNYSPISEITKKIPKNGYTFFPVASPLRLVSEHGFQMDILVKSSDKSFTQVELKSNPSYEKSRDQLGPLPIAIQIEGKLNPQQSKKFRAVIIGDSDFLVNQMFAKVFNRDFGINIITFLTHLDSQLSLQDMQPKSELLLLTDTNYTLLVVIAILISTFLLVAAIILALKARRQT